MGLPPVGAVVLVPFPFSDLSARKLRPAIVAAHADVGDVILCQVTSRSYASRRSIRLVATDFAEGGLNVESHIRPDKLFSADPTLVIREVGRLTTAALTSLRSQIRDVFA